MSCSTLVDAVAAAPARAAGVDLAPVVDPASDSRMPRTATHDGHDHGPDVGGVVHVVVRRRAPSPCGRRRRGRAWRRRRPIGRACAVARRGAARRPSAVPPAAVPVDQRMASAGAACQVELARRSPARRRARRSCANQPSAGRLPAGGDDRQHAPGSSAGRSCSSGDSWAWSYFSWSRGLPKKVRKTRRNM